MITMLSKYASSRLSPLGEFERVRDSLSAAGATQIEMVTWP
jgi:hypothetical protein